MPRCGSHTHRSTCFCLKVTVHAGLYTNMLHGVQVPSVSSGAKTHQSERHQARTLLVTSGHPRGLTRDGGPMVPPWGRSEQAVAAWPWLGPHQSRSAGQAAAASWLGGVGHSLLCPSVDSVSARRSFFTLFCGPQISYHNHTSKSGSPKTSDPECT